MPTLKHLNASKHPNIALAELSLFLTPHRYRKGERLVAKQTDFDDVHRSIAQDMYMYLARPRRNYVLPRSWWYQDLAPCYSYLLGAANLDARIEFSKIAVDALRQHREFYAEPIFFVTVCPRKYVYPIERASQADLHGLRQTTRQALAGLSFVAMIDFALFKSWGKDRIDDMHNRVPLPRLGSAVGRQLDQSQGSTTGGGFGPALFHARPRNRLKRFCEGRVGRHSSVQPPRRSSIPTCSSQPRVRMPDPDFADRGIRRKNITFSCEPMIRLVGRSSYAQTHAMFYKNSCALKP